MKDDIIKQKVKERYSKIALVGSSLDGCCAPSECCGYTVEVRESSWFQDLAYSFF